MTTKVTTLLSQGRSFPQKFARLGSLRAGLISDTPGATVASRLFVVFLDDTREVVWPLEGSSANGVEACCALTPGHLTVAWRSNDPATYSQTVLQEYVLPADPFSVAPSRLGAPMLYGDADSRGTEFVRLDDDTLISLTWQHSAVAVYGAMCLPNRAWAYQGFFVLTPSNATAHQFSCAVRPGRAEVMPFITTDGAWVIDSGVLAVVNGKLELINRLPSLLSQQSPTWLIPNGEIATPIAISDVRNKRILLSYTNSTGELIDGFNAAYPVVAGVGEDLIPVHVLTGPELVRSILNPSPMTTLSGPRPALTYFPGINPLGGATRMAVIVPGAVAGEVIDIPLAPHSVAFSTDTIEYIGQGPTGSINLVRLAMPVPEPTPVPPKQPSLSLLTFAPKCAVVDIGQNLGDQTIWKSSIAGYLGQGSVLEKEIPTKEQVITGTVTDDQGRSSSVRIHVSFDRVSNP